MIDYDEILKEQIRREAEYDSASEYLEKQKQVLSGVVGSAVMIPNAVEEEMEVTQKTFL